MSACKHGEPIMIKRFISGGLLLIFGVSFYFIDGAQRVTRVLPRTSAALKAAATYGTLAGLSYQAGRGEHIGRLQKLDQNNVVMSADQCAAAEFNAAQHRRTQKALNLPEDTSTLQLQGVRPYSNLEDHPWSQWLQKTRARWGLTSSPTGPTTETAAVLPVQQKVEPAPNSSASSWQWLNPWSSTPEAPASQPAPQSQNQAAQPELSWQWPWSPAPEAKPEPQPESSWGSWWPTTEPKTAPEPKPAPQSEESWSAWAIRQGQEWRERQRPRMQKPITRK